MLREPLTSGMVGQTIHFEYSHDFDDLMITAVFTDGKNTINVVNPGSECIIPHEVLTTIGATVKVGIYAVRGDELVIPTVYATIGVVLKGADPSGDESTEPSLPVWAQTQAMIGNLNALETEAKGNLVAAVNEVKHTADSKQDRLIAGDNITIAADGKTISATGGGGSVPKPLTYDYMPEGYPTKAMGTVTIMEEQELAFAIEDNGFYYADLTTPFEIVAGQTYTVKWDGTEHECVGVNLDGFMSVIGNLSILGMGDDTGEPFVCGYNMREAINVFYTLGTSPTHTISVKTASEVITPMAYDFMPDDYITLNIRFDDSKVVLNDFQTFQTPVIADKTVDEVMAEVNAGKKRVKIYMEEVPEPIIMNLSAIYPGLSFSLLIGGEEFGS